ncbi:MAG: tetratricopeptide repeat protein [Acidobacteriota bacterium]
MAWTEVQRQLVERLQRELRSRWGRISETEAALGLSEGYLNKMLSGQRSFRLETFLQAVELLGLDPKAFFSQALDICPRSDDFLAQLENSNDRDVAWLRIERATSELMATELLAVDLEGVGLDAVAPFTVSPATSSPETASRATGCADDAAAASEPAPARKLAGAADAAKFVKLPAREQDRRLRHTSRYRSLPFARAYLEQLDALRYDHAVAAAKRATVALVDFIPQLPGTAKERISLYCLGLGIFGSARRHKGEYTSATRALRQALVLAQRAKLRRDTGNLLLRASYLLKDHAQFERAKQLLGEALVIFTRLGSHSDMGRALVDHGMMLCHSGDFEGAILDLRQALDHIAEAGPELHRYRLSAYQMLAYAHQELGQLEAAEACLERGVSQFGEGHAVDEAKLRWSQALVAYERGGFERSEALLRSAQEVLAEREGPIQSAIISLDLIAALLAQEKRDEATGLAESMAQLVTKLRDNRWAEATLVELIRTAVAGRLSRQMVHAIKEKLAAGAAAKAKA